MYQETTKQDNANPSPPPIEGVLAEREEKQGMGKEGEKKELERKPFDLLQTFLWLSQVDFISFLQALTGFFIIGSTGSGKTSCLMHSLFKAVISKGCGAVVITTKESDIDDYVLWARECDREADLRIIGDGTWRMDMFAHEAANSNPLDIPANLTFMAEQIFELSGSGVEKDFWGQSALALFRNACGLLVDANEPVNLPAIDSIVKSLPLNNDMLDSPQWQQGYCGQCLIKAIERENSGEMSELAKRDWHSRQSFFTNSVPNMPSETLQSQLITYRTAISPILEGSVREFLLSENPNIVPEECFANNLILILNAPCKSLGYSAQALSKVFKFWILKSRERYHIEKDLAGNLYSNPMGFYCDEYGLFASKHDELTFSTQRSAGVIACLATQSLPSIYQGLESRRAEWQGATILANLVNRFVLSISEPSTASKIADDVGRVYVRKANTSMGRNFGNQTTGGGHFGSSFHEELVHQVLPIEFTTLQKANPVSGFCETIFYSHGTMFSNYKNHIRVAFSFSGQSMALEGIEAASKSSNVLGLFFKEFIAEVFRFALRGIKELFKFMFRLVSRWHR